MYQKLEFETDALVIVYGIDSQKCFSHKRKKNQIKNHFNSSVEMENKIQKSLRKM